MDLTQDVGVALHRPPSMRAARASPAGDFRRRPVTLPSDATSNETLTLMFSATKKSRSLSARNRSFGIPGN
jgi:hypothetical protein